MRFNSIERLESWQKGIYPSIHDSIFDLIKKNIKGQNVCDLCCSTGLLGQRIKTELKKNVIGIDNDLKAFDNAKKFNVNIPLIFLNIDAESSNPFFEIIEKNNIDILVARRCISEIFYKKIPSAYTFSKRLAKTQIKQIFVQGRRFTSKATHPLKSVNEEINLFKNDWTVIQNIGECALLEKK